MPIRPPLERVTSDGVPELVTSPTRITNRNMSWLEDLYIGSRGVFDMALDGKVQPVVDGMGTDVLDDADAHVAQMNQGDSIIEVVAPPAVGQYRVVFAAGMANIGSISTEDVELVMGRAPAFIPIVVGGVSSPIGVGEFLTAPGVPLILPSNWGIFLFLRIGAVAINGSYEGAAASVLLQRGEYIP